jgi:hypothetical protein
MRATHPVASADVAGDVAQAVVFDLDGVLIDSEEIWDEVRCPPSRPWAR